MRTEQPEKPHGWWGTIASVLAAGLGVQSNRNRERDFARGSPYRFVVVAVLATLAFIVTVWLVVRVVLSAAGA